MELSVIPKKSHLKALATATMAASAFVVLCGFKTECIKKERLMWKEVMYERSCDHAKLEDGGQDTTRVYFMNGTEVKSKKQQRKIARLFARLPQVVENVSAPINSSDFDSSDSDSGGNGRS